MPPLLFAENVRSNRQLTSKVGDSLAKLLCTWLDGDEFFRCCKDLEAEKMDLGGKMETMAAEKNGLAKVIVDLEAQLKDWESRLEEFEF